MQRPADAAPDARAVPAPSLVVHGHYYQPPREHPELDEVETEPSAAPFHDWNQRIERECYRAVVAARVQERDGRIAQLVNCLEWMSFNVGATLLEWLERQAADTYHAIRAADAASVRRLGHGNAIAQPYHHVILPLASRRDKVTEVRWGIADFTARFGRAPEGMWLPETAVDDETLDVLAAEGIRFTILAPHQVERTHPSGAPLRYVTQQGREIALCVYDGDLAHGVAFGGLLHNADVWAGAIEAAAMGGPGAAARGATARGETVAGPRLVSIATDGETYGHHHRFGEMALARMLDTVRRRGFVVENFASYLARHPAVHEVVLVGSTAWSCAHGIERWRSDCGCRTDGTRFPSQAWRAPLRDALVTLADGLHALFAEEGGQHFRAPWEARDAYGTVVGRADPSGRRAFLGHHLRAGAAAPSGAATRALELLEMERDVLRMFTSCAWFFDDIGGLEPRQVLRYAARALRLAGAGGATLEASLRTTLAMAASNDPAVGNGRLVYDGVVATPWPTAVRVAAAEVAARHVGVHHGLVHPAAEVRVDGSSVVVRDRRTWREERFRLEGVASEPADIVVRLRDTGDALAQLRLTDMPEGARLEVRSVLRRRLLPVYLGPAELDHLAAGDVQLRGVVAVALTRAVERLGTDASPDALARAHGLLDLFEQVEAKVPFDTQTAFWRLWADADAAQRDALRTLRVRLGFAADG